MKLNSLDEWMEVVDTFKRKYGRCETNCYVPLPVLGEYIREGHCGCMRGRGITIWGNTLYPEPPDYLFQRVQQRLHVGLGGEYGVAEDDRAIRSADRKILAAVVLRRDKLINSCFKG